MQTSVKLTHELRNIKGALLAVEDSLDKRTHEDACFILNDMARRLGVLIDAFSPPPGADHAVENLCFKPPPNP